MKATSGIILASIILSGLVFSGSSLFAKANYTHLPPPSISIKSPQAICNNSSPQLEFDIKFGFDDNEITRNAFYSLDGQKNITIPITSVSIRGSTSVANMKTQLPSLIDGYHRIEVFAVYSNKGNYAWAGKSSVGFQIDTNMSGMQKQFTAIYTGDTAPLEGQPSPYFTLLNFTGQEFIDGSLINSQNFSVGVKAAMGEIDLGISLLQVSYKASWQNQSVVIYKNNIDKTHITSYQFGPNTITYLLNLTDVPKGENQIEFFAEGGGVYLHQDNSYKFFNMTETATLNFTVKPQTTNAQILNNQDLALLAIIVIVLVLALATLLLLYRRRHPKEEANK